MDIYKALYLLPVGISDAPLDDVLPAMNIEILKGIRYFIVENVRTARRFIKKCHPAADISSLTFYELNGFTPEAEVSGFLEPLRRGEAMGVMSEAGCPGVADPGALPVRIAQKEGFRVIPLVGPSSILLSLMASGFNGQNFAFHGYLPVGDSERERKIKELESEGLRRDMTQIFIETPYRNQKMFESLLKTLRTDTLLCVSSAVTDPLKQSIITKSVGDWKAGCQEIGKVPTIFLFYNESSGSSKGTTERHGKKKNFI